MANRLASQSSPYLLQHAHNPVDWYPWGEEAFAEARRRGVPIFLSVGYSTCYWCHVMERESFESDAIARIVNERFVAVKVDREERPDVDELYMAATQIMTGRGGWPMSCFLEPEGLRPFWCGTYFPPEPRHGMPSFLQVLEGLSGAWRDRRGEIMEQAGQVAAAVAEHLAGAEAPVSVGLELVTGAAAALLRALDRVHGGFGQAPKFPQPVFLELLLDLRESAGDEATREALDGALRLTLDQMALGGMNDQVGGGFHRYSVDDRWLVPHFEKMLYDNAQLAQVYARAAAMYGDAFYRRTAERTIEYVLREMRAEQGAFFSAQDAEVDGREGANYVWTAEEVRGALGREEADFAVRVYGMGSPNFMDPHHPEDRARNVLFLADRPERMAERLGIKEAEFLARLDAVNAQLYDARAKRKQPRLDDKVLSGWNGLMIGALARAGAALGQPRYVQAGARAAGFVLAGMRTGAGDLLRSWRAGQPGPGAVLEDYAFMVDGLMALQRAGDRGADWLAAARELAERALRAFGDGRGGLFDARAEQSELFVRARSTHDGALPSGASVMLHGLLELHGATREERWLEAAVGVMASVSGALAAGPTLTANSTRALLRMIASAGLADRLGALGPAAAAVATAPEAPVEVYASTDRVRIGTDLPAEVILHLRIHPGYHITAAEPGPAGEGLVPLRVAIINGTGVAVYADYPEGEAYGPDGGLRVHRGEVEFRIALERSGAWSGRPLAALTYQACTETECLAPVTVELAVAIDAVD